MKPFNEFLIFKILKNYEYPFHIILINKKENIFSILNKNTSSAMYKNRYMQRLMLILLMLFCCARLIPLVAFFSDLRNVKQFLKLFLAYQHIALNVSYYFGFYSLSFLLCKRKYTEMSKKYVILIKQYHYIAL